MPLKTIKQVRSDLKMWGIFWCKEQFGQGYASKSVTARLCEMLETEVQISSDLHLFSHHADSIYVPAHIETIGEAISQLPIKYQIAIKDQYIKGKGRSDYYIREAENSLIGLLS